MVHEPSTGRWFLAMSSGEFHRTLAEISKCSKPPLHVSTESADKIESQCSSSTGKFFSSIEGNICASRIPSIRVSALKNNLSHRMVTRPFTVPPKACAKKLLTTSPLLSIVTSPRLERPDAWKIGKYVSV